MEFTRKGLAKLIVPLLLQQAFQVTIGMMDTLMLAGTSEAAVSGASLVGTLDVMLIYIFSALSSGGSILVSRCVGKKDMPAAKKMAKQVLYACTCVAIAVTTVVLILRRPLLNLLFGDAEAEVMRNALDYFFFTALSFPFLAMYESCASVFRSMAKMQYLWINVGMNLINVGLNACFIFGFHMGAAGAGLATLIARVVGAIIMLFMVCNRKYPVCVERLFCYRPDFPAIKEILWVGVPNGIESGMFQFGKLMTQSLVSTLGTASIAANAVASNLVSYQYMPGTAIGLSMITVIGQCLGAGDKEAAKRYARKLLAVNYACLGAVIVTMLIFSKQLIGMYELSDEGSREAFRLLLLHSLFAIAIWPVGFTLPYAFRAAKDVRYTMMVSVSCMWIFRVVGAYILASDSLSLFGWSLPCFGMGVIGVWIAMMIDWIVRVSMHATRFFTGRWLQKND